MLIGFFASEVYEFGGEVGEGLVSLYGLILINDASKNSFSPNKKNTCILNIIKG